MKDPLSLNLYTYCKGNPVRYYDRDGHREEEINDQDGDGIPSSNNNTGLGTPINNDGTNSIGGGGGTGGAISTIGNTGGSLGSVDKLPAPVNNVFLRGIAGATRAANYSSYWQRASLKDAIERFGGENPVITRTSTGKIIYANPLNGMQIVYDEGGNYFRIQNTNGFGRNAYTDLYGKPLPNNVKLIYPDKITEIGLGRDVWQALTHFYNVD